MSHSELTSMVLVAGPAWSGLGYGLVNIADITASGTVTGGFLQINQAADDNGLEVNGYDDRSGKYIKAYIHSNGSARVDTNHTAVFFSPAIGLLDDAHMRWGGSNPNYRAQYVSATNQFLFDATPTAGGARVEIFTVYDDTFKLSLPVGLNITSDDAPITMGAGAYVTISVASATGDLEITNTGGDIYFGGGAVGFVELSADPTDPAEGKSVMWQSDGTGAGDDGDIMMKIRAGGATKTTTLIDFSAV